jgi:hypothetical protein
MGRKTVARRQSAAPSAGDASVSHGASQVVPERFRKTSWWIELVLCLAITLLSIGLHAGRRLHAGAMWRDEINVVNIGLMPTLADVWRWIEIETFPLGWPMTVRAWSAGFGSSDASLQNLGLIIGLAIVAMLWYNARGRPNGLPLVSLALLATNATVVVYGDSARGYGLGTAVGLFAFDTIRRMIMQPSRRRIIVSIIAGTLAVQCMYFNITLLLALGAGGCAISLRRRDWRPAAAIIGVGMIAAVSLLPYLIPVSRQTEWNTLAKSAVSFPWLFNEFTSAANSSGNFMIWVWLLAWVAALAACGYRFFRPRTDGDSLAKDDALFFGCILLFAPVFYFIFIKLSGVPSHPWYYIGILATLAVAIDWALDLAVGANFVARCIRAACVVVMVCAVASYAWQGIHLRLTNIDLVAAELEKTAGPQDMILISPWWPGTTFLRYYHGPAYWSSLPDLGELKLQRYDIMKKKMAEEEPIRQTLQRIADTLSSGHKLYIVGGHIVSILQSMRPEEMRVNVPPIPKSPTSEGLFQEVWSRQVAFLIRSHAMSINHIPIAVDDPVCDWENMPVFVVQGWH